MAGRIPSYNDRYMAFMGMGPKKIPHWEHWSCPDAETYLTGVDYYKAPRTCRLRLKELYPELNLPVPEKDDPIPQPKSASSGVDKDGRHRVRWGAGESSHWDWGKNFTSLEDVLKFSPLKNQDFSGSEMVVERRDYSDEEKLYQEYRKDYPSEWGDKAPEGECAMASFYNTMFMWPLLVFGWENFLAACLLPEFERIMNEFAEINRKVFRVFARLPVNFVVCHDDIVMTHGPVCSPQWMHKYIFPRYEEFWSIVKSSGKRVIFMSDGNMNSYVDDVMACGASGIISEPYTDYKALARKYKDCFAAGEGDNRILMRNNPCEIRSMVLNMVETGKMTGGYMMCIGNHIPWNVPPEAVKCYLDLSRELAHR